MSLLVLEEVFWGPHKDLCPHGRLPEAIYLQFDFLGFEKLVDYLPDNFFLLSQYGAKSQLTMADWEPH